MNKTKIDWAEFTWNPITGCLNHVEGMCKGGNFPCYAHKLANGRLKTRYLANTNIANPIRIGQRDDLEETALALLNDPFYPRFWEDKLGDRGLFQPEPRRIFVCDMSDLFGIGVPTDWTDRVMDQIKIHRQHQFYLLTKQPQKLPKVPGYFPPNAWVGVTATDNDAAFAAFRAFQDLEATTRKFISFEPLQGRMGPVVLSLLKGWAHGTGASWVIIGAQTKPDVNPQAKWVGEIVQAADDAGIPVFLKKNLWDCLYSQAWDVEAFWATQTATLRQELPALKSR
ncbi:hypothetical protein LCGC14_1154370 [marine sediment metagenome]|uniref:DUF5131 family protein n=1 Tax=marine sediment metagenome TaxID=412755 RepID=A0A0F9PCR8_9ZZZZ